MEKKLNYRQDIQTLRGLAVLAVVLFHAFESQFKQGYLGVDVFFVVSGFVVTPLILRIFAVPVIERLPTLKFFYKRRFFRLAPALSVILVFSGILLFLFMDTVQHKLFARQGIFTVILMGNLGANRYSQDYFTQDFNPYIHTWSLAVEEQIYLILPLILIFFFVRHKSIQKTLFNVFLFLTILSFLLFLSPTISESIYSRIWIINDPSNFSFYSPLSRLWQFTLGGIIFLIGKSNLVNKKLRYAHYFFLSFLLIFLFTPINIGVQNSTIAVSLSTALIIILKISDSRLNSIVKKLEWLGDRSYSIYLLHLPLITIAKYSPALEIGGLENRSFQILVAVISTIVIASFIFSKVENKFRLNNKVDTNIKIKKRFKISFILVPLLIFTGINLGQTLDIIKDPYMPSMPKTMPYEWDSNCRVMQRKTAPKNDPCIYRTNKAQGNILIIGDSTAASLSKSLIEFSNKKNYDVYVSTHASCPFIFKDREFKNSDSCTSHNLSILKYLENKKFDFIFYSHSSESIMEASESYSRNKLNLEVLKSLAQIKNDGNQIIFIGVTPVYYHAKTVFDLILNKHGTYSKVAKLDNENLKNTAALFRINYFDIYNLFCSDLRCVNKLGENWKFDDGVHLSHFGAGLLGPKIINLLS